MKMGQNSIAAGAAREGPELAGGGTLLLYFSAKWRLWNHALSALVLRQSPVYRFEQISVDSWYGKL